MTTAEKIAHLQAERKRLRDELVDEMVGLPRVTHDGVIQYLRELKARIKLVDEAIQIAEEEES
jgi:hypothetical protein